jgi:hypothetical protein
MDEIMMFRADFNFTKSRGHFSNPKIKPIISFQCELFLSTPDKTLGFLFTHHNHAALLHERGHPLTGDLLPVHRSIAAKNRLRYLGTTLSIEIAGNKSHRSKG